MISEAVPGLRQIQTAMSRDGSARQPRRGRRPTTTGAAHQNSGGQALGFDRVRTDSRSAPRFHRARVRPAIFCRGHPCTVRARPVPFLRGEMRSNHYSDTTSAVEILDQSGKDHHVRPVQSEVFPEVELYFVFTFDFPGRWLRVFVLIGKTGLLRSSVFYDKHHKEKQ